MQRVLAGNIQVDLKGMLDLLLWRIGVGNGITIEPHARDLGFFKMQPYPVIHQAAVNSLMIGGHDTKKQHCEDKAGRSCPPAYPKADTQAKQQPAKKDADTRPPVAIAPPIESLNALVQTLKLPLKSVESFLLCNHKRFSSLLLEFDCIIASKKASADSRAFSDRELRSLPS